MEVVDLTNCKIKITHEKLEDDIEIKAFDNAGKEICTITEGYDTCMEDWSDDNIDRIFDELKEKGVELTEDDDDWLYSNLEPFIYWVSKNAILPLNPKM